MCHQTVGNERTSQGPNLTKILTKFLVSILPNSYKILVRKILLRYFL
jgi:hypothetical protein